jgi:two-component system cell cycle sensor histidine kinase/response regulator CckA
MSAGSAGSAPPTAPGGERSSDVSLFEKTRLVLARISLNASEELLRGIGGALQASAETLSVDRVGVWMFAHDWSSLRCVALYQRGVGVSAGGAVLDATKFPAYLAAVRARRVIVADDACVFADTCELADSYLRPTGVTSLLDAALYREGEIIGVVCHEHVGPMRAWTPRECDFAASVADIVAVLFEQASRLSSEAALAEQRAREAEIRKLDALGRMGAGLAHDFNNILAAMIMGAEAARLRARSDPAIASLLDAVIAKGALGAKLVRQIMTYARKGGFEPKELDLAELVRALAPVLDSFVHDRCALVVSLPSAALFVHVDRTQVEQLLINLVLNAKDAGAKTITIAVRAEGDEAVIEVSDDGEGMDEATLARAFEPFYSTKERKSGGGLGLPLVQSIVAQHDGRIEVTSKRESGTKFSIALRRTG